MRSIRKQQPGLLASYPQGSDLLPMVAEKEAILLQEQIILFRLNQVYNAGIMVPTSKLLPYSQLGLVNPPLEEYNAIIGGISRFVFKQSDWNKAFELLGEIAFHVFKREELEIAEREGCILPEMEEGIESYVNFYPQEPGIDHYFKSFQLLTPEQASNGRGNSTFSLRR
ncbi:unnamed protein product [Rhizoctonia solani]|uniref:Uncharacterized protein n=1 Tax=Rhizoctonia solani TaxID=456999 RepID=A0A8H2XGW0_9AGAM|nr:unnamed protein product [Rhizoctonia solani]